MALAKYKAIDAMGVLSDPDNAAMPRFVLQLAMFENLLAQSEVRTTLTKDEHKQLVTESLRKLHEKSDADNAAIYGGLSIEATSLIAVRELQRLPITEMQTQMTAQPELARFAADGGRMTPEMLKTILTHGETALAKPELFDAMKTEVKP